MDSTVSTGLFSTMPKTPKTEQSASTKSGVMRLPFFEGETRREPPIPLTVPEGKEDEATTGAIPAVNEGRDLTAIGDADRINGN
jgi:hypothetical protein